MRALNVQEAVLTNARTDGGTLWPDDFDADARRRSGIVGNSVRDAGTG
jgi:hypothetical protein